MSAAADMSAAETADGPPAKGGKKKLLIILALPVLLGGGGAGLWFSGVLPHLLGREPAGHEAKDSKEAKEAAAAPMFVELPDMIANLNSGGRTARFVKLSAKLEVGHEEDRALLAASMPRLVDLFQTYLREMHPEELRGSAGTYRLREELLGRVGVAVPGAHVTDVLFTQMIVQ